MPGIPSLSSVKIRAERRAAGIVLVLLPALLVASPAGGATASKKYRFEMNKVVGIEVAAAGVRAEKILFEFPGSMLRLQTANKARVTVVNGSGSRVRVGLAIALFDAEGNLVAAGTGGNKGGQLAPGETDEFSVFFYYVNEGIQSAATFQISMEVS